MRLEGISDGILIGREYFKPNIGGYAAKIREYRLTFDTTWKGRSNGFTRFDDITKKSNNKSKSRVKIK